ncbi:MAG: HAMP domain-containing histidine kinase [Bifidobacteriaceae bacterium]|jgi:two-component system sensor histidine kinase VanS|nr:HAMP domain-containing histidine kinase [Bifidobacteriaceae bacterium]
MDRPPGWSIRRKLAISYAALLVVAGSLLLAVVLLFLLRYVPADAISVPVHVPGRRDGSPELFIPGRGDLWRAFWPKAAVAMAGLLLFGLIGGWWLAGRMLSPLDRVTEATRQAARGSLSHRINLPGKRDELRELADAFDAMLARIETQVDEQRRFAANASHELRTPLAITQSLLDVAEQDPGLDAEQLVERLQAVNARAIALTEALLTLSRAEQRAFTSEEVDLSLLAEESAETLLPLAEKHHIAIEFSGQAAAAVGSKALLGQLVLNLLHNGIVHNHEGGGVRVSTLSDQHGSTLVIENTGDLLTPEKVATFAEPFQRGDERAHTDQAGVGLGLAIAASIVKAHDGALSLAARPDGGMVARVRFGRSPE